MTVKEYIKKYPEGLVAKAYRFAERAHAGQKRKTGEPYFNHVVAAAENVAGWNLDEQTVAATLLHDTVEDTNIVLDDIKREFGEEIAFLVDGVTKISQIKYRGVEPQVENLRKMLLALSEDIRVVIIKLGDRLHNMRTLNSVPREKQKRIALETMEIYSPIAYRLGMQHLSGELEDLAFPYIYPQEYAWLKREVKDAYEKRTGYLTKVSDALLAELAKHELPVPTVDFRAKRYASLYKKLLRYDMDISKIYDLVALRVIFADVTDCYAALGIVHNLWPPMPGRIKDYIAMPKPNGYQSLHTTVICLKSVLTEIQIKTRAMHEEAENGIAAHWLYEERKSAKGYTARQATAASEHELRWVEQLRNWQKEFTNPDEFIESLKIDFLKDRIFVISPKGEVFDLPVGATPIDFAYQVHSEIGNTCSGARVNGKIVPLDYQLQSGNVIEVVTQKNKKPSASWLEFVKTASARGKIKAALKGTDSLAVKQKTPQLEFRVTAEDRMGLLKDVSAVISRSHVNIVSVSTNATSKFHTMRILCGSVSKEKAEKLALKLKTLEGVKELNYKFV